MCSGSGFRQGGNRCHHCNGRGREKWVAISEGSSGAVGAAPKLSSHLMINTFVVTAAVTVMDRDPSSVACAMESNNFWSTSTSLWNGNMTEMTKNTSGIFKSADLKTPNHYLIFRTNNTNHYVVEQSSGLQVDNLSKVSGNEVFRDSQYMVTVCHLLSVAYSDCLFFYQPFTMLLIFFPPQVQSRISCQYLHCSCKD